MRKIIILGNGPSLLLVDTPRLVKDFATIGTNRILRPSLAWQKKPSWEVVPDIVLIVDYNVLEQELPRINAKKPVLVLYEKWYEKFRKSFAEDLRVDTIAIADKKPANMSMDMKAPYVQNHLNTGLYALEHAYRILQGHGVVGMLGMDFRYVPGYPTHFFGDGRKDGAIPYFKLPINWMRSVKDQFSTNVFKVFNLSLLPGPLDDILPRVTIDEFREL